MREFQVFGLLVAASCTVDSPADSVEVSASNPAGVTSIARDHRTDAHGDVFEVRALKGDEVIATVTRRVGVIDDIQAVVPGEDSIGSEIQFTVNGVTTRYLTRETRAVHLRPDQDALLQSVLALPQVNDALVADQKLYVAVEANELAADTSDERALTWGSCWNGYLLSATPTATTAQQCCFSDYEKWYSWGLYQGKWTDFVRNDGAGVQRFRHPWQTCVGQYAEPCSGAACYYGPSGFARAITNPPGAGNVIRVLHWTEDGNYNGTLASGCGEYAYPSASAPAKQFADITGANHPAQGCCVDQTGPCGPGLYKSCESCGGGGSAGRGAWDY